MGTRRLVADRVLRRAAIRRGPVVVHGRLAVVLIIARVAAVPWPGPLLPGRAGRRGGRGAAVRGRGVPGQSRLHRSVGSVSIAGVPIASVPRAGGRHGRDVTGVYTVELFGAEAARVGVELLSHGCSGPVPAPLARRSGDLIARIAHVGRVSLRAPSHALSGVFPGCGGDNKPSFILCAAGSGAGRREVRSLCQPRYLAGILR